MIMIPTITIKICTVETPHDSDIVLKIRSMWNSMDCPFQKKKCFYMLHLYLMEWIHSRIVKLTYEYFLVPLVHICTLSLIHGVSTYELKITKVIHLYKGGNARLFVNYRTVSILPIFLNIYERLVYYRLSEFTELSDILYRLQSGFRKRHSTSVALMVLTDKITTALNGDEYVLGVNLDFSKAVDLVTHEILLHK